MNKVHEGEIGDPIISLGNERDKLLEKINHLSRQWRGAINADPKQIILTLDLQAEVENELEGAYMSLHAVEQKIAEISATNPEGLRVKLRLLAAICDSLIAEMDQDGWSEWERLRESTLDESSEGFDDLTSRNLRENIGLAAQLAGPVSTDIEHLIDPALQERSPEN